MCKRLVWMAWLGAMTACGGANAGELLGTGGNGGSDMGTGGSLPAPPMETRTFEVACLRPDLDLTFDIELRVDLDAPFGVGESTEVTFTPTVTMLEETAAALIDATVETIDITAMSVQTRLSGTDTSAITSALVEAPIQDFDLADDPDENGTPGPHRFELPPASEGASVVGGADRVEFVLSTIAFEFGDFRLPESCVDALSVVGTPLTFPVSSD